MTTYSRIRCQRSHDGVPCGGFREARSILAGGHDGYTTLPRIKER